MFKIKQMIIYGDSIGKGVIWNDERQRYCISKNACIKSLSAALPFPVENRCAMGNTVEKCLTEFKSVKPIRGAAVVFELGSNDSDMPWDLVSAEPGREHPARVPLHEFYRDYRDLIRLAKRRHMIPVAAVPIPLDGEKYLAWVSRGLSRENILRYLGDPVQMSRWQERYAAAVRDVARQERVRIIDLRDYMLKNRQFKTLYCEDGIHLNDRGQQYLFDCLKEDGLIFESGSGVSRQKTPATAKTVCAVC